MKTALEIVIFFSKSLQIIIKLMEFCFSSAFWNVCLIFRVKSFDGRFVSLRPLFFAHLDLTINSIMTVTNNPMNNKAIPGNKRALLSTNSSDLASTAYFRMSTKF